MPDYGHDLLFGTFVTPVAARVDDVLRLAKLTEDQGYDLVSIQDHPYQSAFLDTWTLLTYIAAQTSRVRVMPDVASLPMRPPAVLARAAASLDILSGGRVELGMGAGAFWDAVVAMGGPRRTPGESVEALEEAIRVIRTLWTPGRTERINGKHYQLNGARSGPYPVHGIGIWVGANKPRMLRLIGRMADGWVPSSTWAPPAELPRMNRIIDAAAQEAGRSPSDIRRLYNVGGQFNAEELAELALEHGMSVFITSGDDETEIRRFAAEVIPATREIVARERNGSEGSGGDNPFLHLGVTPTPDDGHRLTTTRLWDESTRPTGPTPAGDTIYTPSGRYNAKHLIEVHDMFRQGLAQLREMVGDGDIGAARAKVNSMALRVGGQHYCRMLTMHHMAEDQMLFTQIRQHDSRLAPVIDQLEREHHAIAEVLEAIDQRLSGRADLDGIDHTIDVLSDALLSHLSYEERELVEPLARVTVQM